MPLAPGAKVGSYEVLALLGAGGMGEVYRARDPRLNREVALKVLPDTFAANPERMARFEREARVLASLNHPNIAQIYGVEERALVMELVAGDSLRGPMPFDDAWKIAAQIAEALEYAHEKGIVHRDLKPANIKVTPDGVVKLLDFGLAKAFPGSSASSDDLNNSPTLSIDSTRSGVILGTAAYMAPEQAKGADINQRADIWAFGVVLYELLAGQRPFRGASVAETVATVIHEVPDFSLVPSQARPLLERCLQKDPKNRLRHIGDAKLLLGSSVATTAPPAFAQAKNILLLAVALVVATLLLAILAFVHFRETFESPPMVRMNVLLPEKSRVLSLAVSPNGREIAMVLVREGKQQIWIRVLNTLEPTALAGTDNASDPFWSPDSRSLGFFADSKLKKIDHAGGPVQTLCDALAVRGGAWNRNGDILFGGLERILRIPAAGGAVSDLPNHSAVTEIFPVFLPGGQHYLATREGDVGAPQTGIWLSSINNGDVRRILPDASNASVVEPPPGSNVGNVIFVRAGTLMALPFDMKRLEPAGDAFPVAQNTAQGMNPYWLAAASGQGTLVYVTGQRGGWQYVWQDRQGKQLGAVGEAGSTVVISPDGKQLAGDPGGNRGQDVWLLEFARGVPSRLTFAPPESSNPVWSPDGKYVAYFKSGTGICRKLATGAGPEDVLFRTEGPAFPKSWSPDGRFLMFAQINRGTGADLMAIPLQGDPMPFVVAQTPATEDQGQFSPDGHWVGYTSNESGQSEIYVIPFPPSPTGGRWQVSRSGGVAPRWRRDGKELFYVSPDSKLMAVEVTTQPAFQAGTPQALFQTEMVDTGIRTGPMSWDVAPNGNRFLIISERSNEVSSLRVDLNWRSAQK